MLRLAVVLALLALATGSVWACEGLSDCAVARAMEPAGGEPNRGATVEVSSTPLMSGSSSSPSPALQGTASALGATPRELEMRLWMKRGSASFGAGLSGSFTPSVGEQQLARRPGEAGAGELLPRDMLIGVRYNIAGGSRVFADHVTSSLAGTPLQAAGLDRTVRVGLEFKAAKNSALAGLPAGTLLRLQLSRDANLALRPRHGGLALTLRSQW